jgi:hypothetical protein
VPDSRIRAFIHEDVWGVIVSGGSFGVEEAIVNEPKEPKPNITAVVLFPLTAQCKAIRLARE